MHSPPRVQTDPGGLQLISDPSLASAAGQPPTVVSMQSAEPALSEEVQPVLVSPATCLVSGSRSVDDVEEVVEDDDEVDVEEVVEVDDEVDVLTFVVYPTFWAEDTAARAKAANSRVRMGGRIATVLRR